MPHNVGHEQQIWRTWYEKHGVELYSLEGTDSDRAK